MRKGGKTYSEIRLALGHLPKSTLSNWLKPVELTFKQRLRIAQKIVGGSTLGRQRGGWKNHEKRLARIAAIQKVAAKEFAGLKNDHFFVPGLLLYLAEGSKKAERFQFMNSDPHLVRYMQLWLHGVAKIKNEDIRSRLYTHKFYAHDNHEKFWSDFLKIPLAQFYQTIYKPTGHRIKKNPSYRGCIRIEIGGSELYWKIMKWRDLLYATL